MIAKLFPVDGPPQEVEFDGSLKRAQELVGGWVEQLTLRPPDLDSIGAVLLFDEEGLLKNLPRNKHWRVLVGPVLMCGVRCGEDGQLWCGLEPEDLR